MRNLQAHAQPTSTCATYKYMRNVQIDAHLRNLQAHAQPAQPTRTFTLSDIKKCTFCRKQKQTPLHGWKQWSIVWLPKLCVH